MEVGDVFLVENWERPIVRVGCTGGGRPGASGPDRDGPAGSSYSNATPFTATEILRFIHHSIH